MLSFTPQLCRINLLIFLFLSNALQAQNVGIGTPTPDNSAKLHIESSSRGLLIPRLVLDDASTAAPVTTPATGLLIYNQGGAEPDGFYYWSGTNWVPLASATGLSDLDGDTRILVEQTPDEDIIRFETAGTEVMTHRGIGLELNNPNNSMIIGRSAGNLSYTGAENTMIGDNSGTNLSTGFRNTFVGYNAGNANTSGSTNTFLGRTTGQNNTTGSQNTFLGTATGQNNLNGNNNTFLGQGSGLNNISGSNNTFVGRLSGRDNTADENTFIGTQAGLNNT
jgi:hypothetical protein